MENNKFKDVVSASYRVVVEREGRVVAARPEYGERVANEVAAAMRKSFPERLGYTVSVELIRLGSEQT